MEAVNRAESSQEQLGGVSRGLVLRTDDEGGSHTYAPLYSRSTCDPGSVDNNYRLMLKNQADPERRQCHLKQEIKIPVWGPSLYPCLQTDRTKTCRDAHRSEAQSMCQICNIIIVVVYQYVLCNNNSSI